MIPYEELVVALQTWRAKKGLPITQMSGSFAPPPVITPPAAPAPPPARTAPPTPAPRAKPMAPPPEHETIDAASLLDDEDSYQNEGNDFAMEFPHNSADEGEGGESTMIGAPPSRPSDLATDPGVDSVARGNKRNNDW